MEPQTKDWQKAWLPVIELAGHYMVNEDPVWAADAVEAGAIRKWLEPLEWDCALHTDRSVARALGHNDVVAPAVSLPTFSHPALWKPGKVMFNSAERNAQPETQAMRPPLPPGAPAYSCYFGTDMAYDVLRPVEVGERLGRRGPRLLSCTPKSTKVGLGAFITFETETVSDRGDVVSRFRFCVYCYNPHPLTESAAS